MSQPPPQRPWFRLASMVRPNLPPPPPPPPVQQPTFRPPVIMPTVTPPPPPPTSQPIPPRTSAPPSPLPTRTTAPPPTSEPIPPRTSAPPSPLPTRTSTPPSSIPPTSAVVPSPPRHSTEPPSPLPPRTNETPSPPPPRPNALPSPANTPPHTILNYIIANQSPKSPAKNVDPTKTNSPNITPAQSPPHQASSTKPNSPIITKTLSSLPASPKFFSPKPSAPHPSPLPTYTSTPFQTVPSSPIATGSARTLRPWVETPPQSVKEKMLSHPPSPLTLPPAQIINPGNDHHMEAIPTQVEQKTVLLQDIEQKSKTTPKISNSMGHLLHNYHHEKKEQHKKDKGVNTQTKKHSHDHSEENVARVVTLAGENKGAIMELSPASRKQNGGGNKVSSKDHEKHKALGTETAAAMDAFINSNVQGVNNSVLYNCEFTHNDPGVHLSVSRKSNGNGRRGVHE